MRIILAGILAVLWAGCAESLVDPETVKQRVVDVNRPPVAVADSVTALQAVPVVINILLNDLDTDGHLDPSSVILSDPAHGQVKSLGDSTVTYVVGYEFLGVDTFTYTVADDFGVRSEPAVVRVAVVLSPPLAPELVLPADGAVHLDPRVSFMWEAVPRADEYRLEVSFTEDFSSVAFASTQPARTSVVALDRDTVYFWRVRAVNAAGPGAWSPVRTFSTVPTAPGVPMLLSPVDNALAVPLDPVLRWQDQPGTATYYIQVATNVAFAGAAFEATVSESEVRVPSGRLEIGKRYFWRVRGANAGGSGPWSPSWSFVTVVGIPGVASLTSPDAGATDVPLSPLLRWDPVDEAASYRLQVSRDETFSSPVFDDVGSTVERIVPAGRLAYQTTYWWRVRAVNVAGAGPWSEARTFSTAPPPPAVPIPVSPVDGAVGVSVAPTLTWSLASGATSYRVEMADAVSFDTLLYHAETEGLFVSLPSKWLEPGMTVYWRVRSINPGGTSDWSDVYSFQTESEDQATR